MINVLAGQPNETLITGRRLGAAGGQLEQHRRGDVVEHGEQRVALRPHVREATVMAAEAAQQHRPRRDLRAGPPVERAPATAAADHGGLGRRPLLPLAPRHIA